MDFFSNLVKKTIAGPFSMKKRRLASALAAIGPDLAKEAMESLNEWMAQDALVVRHPAEQFRESRDTKVWRWALSTQSESVANCAREAGFSADARRDGAIEWAIRNTDATRLSWLRPLKSLASWKNADGVSAFDLAVQEGKPAIAKALAQEMELKRNSGSRKWAKKPLWIDKAMVSAILDNNAEAVKKMAPFCDCAKTHALRSHTETEGFVYDLQTPVGLALESFEPSKGFGVIDALLARVDLDAPVDWNGEKGQPVLELLVAATWQPNEFAALQRVLDKGVYGETGVTAALSAVAATRRKVERGFVMIRPDDPTPTDIWNQLDPIEKTLNRRLSLHRERAALNAAFERSRKPPSGAQSQSQEKIARKTQRL